MREKHRHWPAAAARRQLNGCHVYRIEVRAFFAVDLDVDKVFVHQAGSGFVFKRFMGHHVAPVAGGVSDAQENRLVFLPGAGQRLLAPGIPVDRIVCVLEEIGGGFVY